MPRLVSIGLVALLSAGLLAGPAAAAVRVEGDLPRQADLGFRVRSMAEGLVTRRVDPQSAAHRAGLRDGDRLTRINGASFAKTYQGEALLEKLDGEKPLRLAILRDGASQELAFTPGPLATIFFVQWVSCDSVEFTDSGAWIDVFKAVAQRSGMAMIRVERSANGDSEGPACHELDLETELAHYRYAFDRLTRSPHVDPERVVVLGNSLGSMLVPMVAQGRQVAGAAITSGGGLSYYERMLHFDRTHLERGGGAPGELHEKLMAQARFQVEYLLNGRTPEEIAARDPELGKVWGQIPHVGDGVHYGRPYAYHHQAARLNLLGAWAAIDAPVLVLYNEFDQYESRRGAEVVVETVNRLRPGTARLVVLPMQDHSFYLHPSADAAFSGDGGVAVPEPGAQAILDWLQQAVPRSR